MATTSNNPTPGTAADDAAEREQARRLAERYRCPFIRNCFGASRQS
jgi:cytochrome c-type biogenesis protein CcmH/NrfF